MGPFENQFGKISASVFKENIFGQCGAERKEVICGPSFGVDTSIIDLGNDQVLAVSSDPLSLIPSLGMKVSAWLSVHLLANDMSTTGLAPQYAQFVLNLPPSLPREQFEEYWQHIHQLCKETNIAITGGHTGQIPGQESTIAGGGTMFLHGPKDKVITSNCAQPGDSIIVTKQAAISSSALLAMAFPKHVKQHCGEHIQEQVANNFWQISVLPEALLASKALKPQQELHAMHDVTEGGVLGAIYEMATASGCGFEVHTDKIPVSAEVQQVADLFKIDPLLSIGAGSMIMSVKKGTEKRMLDALAVADIPAAHVGTFTEEKNIIVEADESSTDFYYDGIDPYWEAFFTALNTGLK